MTRFRYVRATKSVEILDREEVITEQTKCLNNHVGPPITWGLWSVLGAIIDDIKCARLATCK